MSLTGQDKYRKGVEPLLEEVKFVPRNDSDTLRATVNDNTAAIILEPIFGEGGIHECSPEFLQECRAAADGHRAALIFDEIQCGLGRTGVARKKERQEMSRRSLAYIASRWFIRRLRPA